MRAHVLSLAFVAAALAACGGCHRKKPAPTVSAIASTESAILPRAPDAKDVAVHATARDLTVGGLARHYLLVEPDAPTAGKRALVLVIHGDGGSMTSLHEAWPFERASQNDAYVVYLEGRNATWDLETLKDNLDIDYAEAVVKEVVAELPIDPERVFAAGYSSGGFFANVLACHRAGLLRAIASNAGGAPYNQAENWENGFPKCPGQKPTAVLSLHGERDGTVTLDSGRFDAEYWAYVNGCDPKDMDPTGYPECRVYRGCPKGKAVGFCRIPDLDHWFWSESTAAIWGFFKSQSP